MMLFVKVALLISGTILLAIALETPGTQLVETVIAGIMLGFAVGLKD